MSKEKDYYDMGLVVDKYGIGVQSMIAAQFVQMNKFILTFDFIIFVQRCYGLVIRVFA